MIDLAADLAIEAAAKMAVRTWLRSHPTYLHDYDELLSDARLGAVKAAQSFDPDLGIERGWWLWRRARGEMIDGVRSRDLRSRKQFDSGAELLPAQRAPLSYEVALGEAADDHWQHRVESWLMLEPALRRLPERQRIVLVACDGYGVHLREVAEWWGVTVARISQIRKQARTQMRELVQMD